MAPIDVVVYSIFAVGYVLVLALTERAAGRFVRGETEVPRDRSIRIRVGVVPAASLSRHATTRPIGIGTSKRSAA